jgi:hypothetical protein
MAGGGFAESAPCPRQRFFERRFKGFPLRRVRNQRIWEAWLKSTVGIEFFVVGPSLEFYRFNGHVMTDLLNILLN